MKKDRYIYPAIFEYAEDGINVIFPDIPGCFTCGDDSEEAFLMAKEALALNLFGMEEDGEPIPAPSSPNDIDTSQDQSVVLIEIWMPPFRHEMHNQSVKKTLSIPRWLDSAAKEHKINYSHLLQEALKEHLGIQTGRK